MNLCKVSIFFFLFSVVQQNQSFGQNCNCLKIPYQPDSCFYPCSKKLLDSADKFELVLILGLSDTLATTIESIAKKGNAKYFSDYVKQLKAEDSQKLFNSIRSLSPQQAFYLNLDRTDRTLFAGDMDRLMKQRENMQ